MTPALAPPVAARARQARRPALLYPRRPGPERPFAARSSTAAPGSMTPGLPRDSDPTGGGDRMGDPDPKRFGCLVGPRPSRRSPSPSSAARRVDADLQCAPARARHQGHLANAQGVASRRPTRSDRGAALRLTAPSLGEFRYGSYVTQPSASDLGQHRRRSARPVILCLFQCVVPMDGHGFHYRRGRGCAAGLCPGIHAGAERGPPARCVERGRLPADVHRSRLRCAGAASGAGSGAGGVAAQGRVGGVAAGPVGSLAAAPDRCRHRSRRPGCRSGCRPRASTPPPRAGG